MPWIRMPGLPGKVYVPEDDGHAPKKHPCKTCHACQWCDENRCRVCRGGRGEADEIKEQHCCERNRTIRNANSKSQAPNLK